jgi:hypothetical protein
MHAPHGVQRVGMAERHVQKDDFRRAQLNGRQPRRNGANRAHLEPTLGVWKCGAQRSRGFFPRVFRYQYAKLFHHLLFSQGRASRATATRVATPEIPTTLRRT